MDCQRILSALRSEAKQIEQEILRLERSRKGVAPENPPSLAGVTPLGLGVRNRRGDGILPKQQTCVIPFRRSVPVSDADKLIADVAYRLWLLGAFGGVSPETALLTAMQIVKSKSSPGLFLVPTCRHNLHPIL